MVLAALASGCGGGSDRSGDRPADLSSSQGPGATVTPQASDGQLGGAVVARPGIVESRGQVERITGKPFHPRSTNHGVGAEQSCSDVDVQPSPQNLAHVSDVIFCLMNAMRANAGLPPLTQESRLAGASIGHSQDMVDNKYFAHDALDGTDLVARLRAAAYIPRAGQWVVGENLAWGAGSLATPQALVNAWMNSPPHRENLLASDFREVGMGVVFGTPSQDAPDGVTVTTDFGTLFGSAVTAQNPVATKRSRRARALRACSRKRGQSRRRCVRAARRRV